jgi:hypothetical protein
MSDPVPTVYVGPSSLKLGLQQYQMYLSLSEAVETARNEHPSLNLLLLPLDVFHDVKQDIFAGKSPRVSHAVTQLQTDGVL